MLLLLPLLVLFFIPAYAETTSMSMTGYEITFENYSQIWFEFEGNELKSAQFSLPVFKSGEWISSIYDLPNPTYYVDNSSEKYDEIWGEKYGKTFTITSELFPNIIVVFDGEYVDNDTILMDGEIRVLDPHTGKQRNDLNVIKLQYLVTVT